MPTLATLQIDQKARSGVYLPSVYNTEDGGPQRGSHALGSHWFYNNWDFKQAMSTRCS